ncbi:MULTISPECIES: hypothetical protein [unclassified Mesorhizobium]|uniref:hypothetical protein n=1 Tax=unclassified Mesorhizobium TaxID=325217 RepID=UPI00167B81CD|nr:MULTISPECIES: hypothetical protein [unclassified Mesorhizobium]
MGEILTLERGPERSSDEIAPNEEKSLFRQRGTDHTPEHQSGHTRRIGPYFSGL